MTPGIRIVLLLLALIELALAAFVVVTLDRRNRRLRGRVEGLGAAAPAIPAAIARSAFILRRDNRRTRGQMLRGLLGIPNDALPGATISRPVAIAAALMGGFLAALPCALYVSPLAAPFAALPGAAVLVRYFYGWQRRKYAGKLLRQMPDTIELVVSAVRAGLPVAEALRSVAREMPPPTCDEFARACNAITLGTPPDVAVRGLHDRSGLTEYGIFAVTLAVQSRSGGRLAETIQNLAETTRQRVAMASKAKALSAEARLSAYALIIMPVIAAIALTFLRPGYIDDLFLLAEGRRMLLICLGLLTVGSLVMRFMIQKAGEP